MPRNITLRCSDETFKRIQTAIAVRGSGLFPPVEHDAETTDEAATVAAILDDWKAGLTPESLAKGRDARIEAVAAPFRPSSCDPGFAVDVDQMRPEPACEQKAELPLKRKPKADDGI